MGGTHKKALSPCVCGDNNNTSVVLLLLCIPEVV